MFGTGSTAKAAYVAETTPGTTPATPTFKQMRVTSSTMRANKATVVSDERQPDRNVRDEMLVGVDAGGAYNFELTYGSLDDFLAAALFGSWATNVLKNGTTRQFFTFEETVDLGATDSFQRYPLGMVNSLSLDIQSRRQITGSFEVFAQRKLLATTAITGATYTPPNTTTVMTASSSFGSLAVAGMSPVPKLRRLSLQVANNLRRRPVIGSNFSEEYGEGRMDVTGSIEAYFESNALYQAVLDHGGGAITANLGHVTAEKYTVALPNVVFLDGAAPIGGQNDDVIVTIPFRAKYDSGIAASIQITRAVA